MHSIKNIDDGLEIERPVIDENFFPISEFHKK